VRRRGAEQPLEIGVLPHAIAVASDVDDVTVVDQPVDQSDVVHVNLDFPQLFDAVAASDHEPLIARFSLP
jgi:hypothetical protein